VSGVWLVSEELSEVDPGLRVSFLSPAFAFTTGHPSMLARFFGLYLPRGEASKPYEFAWIPQCSRNSAPDNCGNALAFADVTIEISQQSEIENFSRSPIRNKGSS
jgi:hypothetical protein